MVSGERTHLYFTIMWIYGKSLRNGWVMARPLQPGSGWIKRVPIMLAHSKKKKKKTREEDCDGYECANYQDSSAVSVSIVQ